jgi:diguanylate cyclase (GGDEF)-like protein
VNERFGHQEGDRLLRAVAGRLAAALPRGATLTRHGGDEFVVLGAPDAAPALAAALAEPFTLSGGESVTIGLHVARARVSYDLEAALGDAALQLKPNM